MKEMAGAEKVKVEGGERGWANNCERATRRRSARRGGGNVETRGRASVAVIDACNRCRPRTERAAVGRALGGESGRATWSGEREEERGTGQLGRADRQSKGSRELTVRCSEDVDGARRADEAQEGDEDGDEGGGGAGHGGRAGCVQSAGSARAHL